MVGNQRWGVFHSFSSSPWLLGLSVPSNNYTDVRTYLLLEATGGVISQGVVYSTLPPLLLHPPKRGRPLEPGLSPCSEPAEAEVTRAGPRGGILSSLQVGRKVCSPTVTSLGLCLSGLVVWEPAVRMVCSPSANSPYSWNKLGEGEEEKEVQVGGEICLEAALVEREEWPSR